MRRVIFIAASVLLLVLCALVIGLNTRPSLHHWADFRATDADLSAPPGSLNITWLGTATVLISDGETSLLSDGFFSRPSLISLACGPIEPNRKRIEQALAEYGIDSLDAVMVLHSHYDHAMDAPVVAQQTGALLMGSSSSANVARGLGLPEQQIRTVTAGEPIRIGAFKVTFLVSDHVPQNALIDQATGMNKPITEPLTPPAWVHQWKEGESWAVMVEHDQGKILLQGSAGYRSDQLAGYQADLAMVSSVGLFRQNEQFQQEYFHETVSATGAETVVPIHWDDFFTPLTGQDTPPLPWLIEHLNGSFQSLSEPARKTGVRFMVVSPGQTFSLDSGQADAGKTAGN